MRRSRLLSLATAAAVLIGGGLLATTRNAPDPSGTWLRDEHGRALVLRGFNTAGSAKSSPDGMPDFTEDDLDREHADMGTNFVRFLISWRSVEPEPGTYDQAYLDRVAERVGWYSERGYHVMLDMHQDLWSSAITPAGDIGNGAPEWATYLDGMPVGTHDMWELYYLDPGVIRAFDNFWDTTGEHPELAEHYAGAWRAVAERFDDESAVIAYDLMNEPYGGTLQGPAFEAGPLTSLYQRTTDAIREVDVDTWVCVTPQAMGTNWGTASGLGMIADPRQGGARIAYCPHLYPLPMDLGEGYQGTSGSLVNATVDAWRDHVLRTADALGGVPVILGEFGLDTTLPGAMAYVDRVYDTAREMGAGVSYWSRDDGSWGPYESDGTARNLVAALDQPYPRAVAGTPIDWSASADRLLLTYRPDPEITQATEIYLPQAGFGADVEVKGAEIVEWDAATRLLAVRGDPTAKVVTLTVVPAR